MCPNRTRKEVKKVKRMVVEMEDSLHTAVKMQALKQGKSAKQFVTEVIERELRVKSLEDVETKKEQTQ